MSVNPSTASTGPDRTAFAVICSVLFVIPALIPAALTVIVYRFFLQGYVGNSWIPYLDQIALQWFPELVRGLIVGLVAMAGTRWLFKSFNADAVRYATLAFWGGVVLLILIFSVSLRGLTFDLIGATATIVGLGIGLWADELT